MEREQELNLFLEKADEVISSKYILANVKIVNLLRAIATSQSLVAIFKSCLNSFDYESAQKKYFVKNKYLPDNRGEFILPSNSKELLALIFNVLMDIDSKRLDLGELINKYFYVDGSSSAGYDNFVNAMIKPFKNSVKILMESVIEGKVQDPIEALTEEENRRAKEKEERAQQEKIERELSRKIYGENVKKIKEIMLADKTKIKASKLSEDVKEEFLLVTDMLANVVDGEDKSALTYAFIAYKYMAKAKPFFFAGRARKVGKLVKGILNEI